MALSTATEQFEDTRAWTVSSVFLSGWQNPNIQAKSGDPDDVFSWKVIADRPWTKATFWALGSNSTPDFSFDVILDYVPSIADTDDWDPVVTNSGTITVTPTGTKNADLAEFTIAGLVPGTMCYLRYTLNNWTNGTNRTIRIGSLHLHTPADA